MAAEEEKTDTKTEKIMTATKKGAAVLDQWLPDDIKTQYHVLQLVILDTSVESLFFFALLFFLFKFYSFGCYCFSFGLTYPISNAGG